MKAISCIIPGIEFILYSAISAFASAIYAPNACVYAYLIPVLNTLPISPELNALGTNETMSAHFIQQSFKVPISSDGWTTSTGLSISASLIVNTLVSIYCIYDLKNTIKNKLEEEKNASINAKTILLYLVFFGVGVTATTAQILLSLPPAGSDISPLNIVLAVITFLIYFPQNFIGLSGLNEKRKKFFMWDNTGTCIKYTRISAHLLVQFFNLYSMPGYNILPYTGLSARISNPDATGIITFIAALGFDTLTIAFCHTVTNSLIKLLVIMVCLMRQSCTAIRGAAADEESLLSSPPATKSSDTAYPVLRIIGFTALFTFGLALAFSSTGTSLGLNLSQCPNENYYCNLFGVNHGIGRFGTLFTVTLFNFIPVIELLVKYLESNSHVGEAVKKYGNGFRDLFPKIS